MLCMYYHLATAENISTDLQIEHIFKNSSFSREFLKEIINKKLHNTVIEHLMSFDFQLPIVDYKLEDEEIQGTAVMNKKVENHIKILGNKVAP